MKSTWFKAVVALAWPLVVIGLLLRILVPWADSAGHVARLSGLYLVHVALAVLYVISYRLYRREERWVPRQRRRGFTLVTATLVATTLLISIGYNEALALSSNARISLANLTGPLILASFLMSFASGVAEEYALRGIVQLYLLQKAPVFAVMLIQGALFSALHTIAVDQSPASVFFYFLNGVTFSVIAYRYQSIMLCAAVHLTWDFGHMLFYGVQTGFDHQDGILLTTILEGRRYTVASLATLVLLSCVVALPFVLRSIRSACQIRTQGLPQDAR